jgi:hypothetical protein
MTWRDRAVPVSNVPALPAAMPPYIDNIGLKPLNSQSDVMNAMGNSPPRAVTGGNWRDRAQAVQVQPAPTAQPQAVEEPSFLKRIGQAYDKRAGMTQEAADAYQRGEQGLPETFMQVTGKGPAGFAGDVTGLALSKLYDITATQPTKEAFSDVATAIKDSPVGDLAGRSLAKYQSFAQGHPRFARNIESLANIGGYLASLTPVKGQSVAGFATDAVSPITVGAKSLIKAPVKGAKNIARGVAARGDDALDAAFQARRLKSADAYNRMRQSGATFTPDTATNIPSSIETALKNDGILNPRLHDKTLGLLSDFKEAAAKGDLGLEGLDQWRQLFGEVAGNFNDPVNARKARIAIDAIDDAVDTLDAKDLVSGTKDAIDALKAGRHEYAQARKFETVADIIKKSDGDANYLKRELKKLLDNKKKSRGFSPDERKALKEASKLSFGEGTMKMLGKFGIDLGGSRIGNTGLPVIGGLLTGMGAGTGAGLALPAIGTVARQGQKYAARGKAENLLKLIEKN